MKNVLKKWAFAVSILAISAVLTACSEGSGQQEDVNSAVDEILQSVNAGETDITTTVHETEQDSNSDKTPNFIGLTEDEAVELCEENNYKYVIEHQCIENISNAVGFISKQDVSLKQVNDGNSTTQEVTYILTVFDDFKPLEIPERNYKFQIESFSVSSGGMGMAMIGKQYYYDDTGHITKIEKYYGTGIYKSE